ncbi:uncharacterized protein LOC135213619 [Macrobrachium nipponense]|uniref:uncharacterized protein LOC135213619 n=1 Tax=Macrobrachium nipponense TaxID=159736 RepID=UPI0030C7D374
MASPQRHFLLLVFAKIVLAYPSGTDIKDCAVNDYQEVNIRTIGFEIGFWVPTGGEDSILNLTITFEEKEKEIWHDKIEFFRKKYKFTRRTGIHEKSQNESKLAWEVMKGWATFRLEINNQYKLFYVTLNGSKLLLEETYNNTLKSLRIEGSNVTLDCLEKLRTWEVAGEPAVIPLDKSKQHYITLFSTKDIYGSIKLGSKEYPLRWSNQTIISIEGNDPLPKFISHNITIDCESGGHGVVCLIKDATHGKLLERVTLSKLPDHLSVKKDKGYAFTAILHQQNFSSTKKHPSGEGCTVLGDDAKDIQFISSMTAIIIGVSFVLGFGIYFGIKKFKRESRCHQRRKADDSDVEVALTEGPKTSGEQNDFRDPTDVSETKAVQSTPGARGY